MASQSDQSQETPETQAPAADAAEPGTLVPTALRCDGRRGPLHAARRPRLSWRNAPIGPAGESTYQKAHQIAAASTRAKLDAGDFDGWDTGRVEAELPAFASPPRDLEPRRRVWWKVRVWDAAGHAGPWSEPAFFGVGLIDPGDWRARWVGLAANPTRYPPPACGPRVAVDWAGDGTGHVRFALPLNESFPRPLGHLFLQAPAAATMALHGQLPQTPPADAPSETTRLVVLWDNLKAGENVVTLKLRRGEAGGGDGDDAVAGVVRVYESSGQWRDAADSSTWQTSADGETWRDARVVGPWGDGPWGDAPLPFDSPRRAVFLHDDFALDPARTPESATVYVTGLGFYDLHLNGRRVGDEAMAPGWTEYRRRIPYQAFDVTNLLRTGDNRVAAALGNGFHTSGMGYHHLSRFAPPDEPLRLLLQLEVTYDDGTREVVSATGDSWKASVYERTSEDTVYHGQHDDGRKADAAAMSRPGVAVDGATAAVVLTRLENAAVEPAIGPPTRATQELRAVKIAEPSPGVFVLDFGQNHTSMPRYEVATLDLLAGTAIRVRHSEVLLPDGNLYLDNYRTARVEDRYVVGGGDGEVWQPAFTYRGMRYAEVTGLPPGKRPTADFYVSRAVHNDAELVGDFECSDATLNAAWRNTVWGLRGNIHAGVPTDCPQRDERLGWTGDTQCFAPTALWTMDLGEFYRKWMADVRDAQQPSGLVPSTVPNCVTGHDSTSAAWGDAVCTVPWSVYRATGDATFLSDNYPAMRRWADYLHATAEGGLREREALGDWLQLADTPAELVGSAYYFLSTKLAADAADLLGKTADAAELRGRAETAANAYHAFHFDPKIGRYKEKTQAADVLPLAFGITPPNLRQTVADAVAADVRQHGGLTTGFVATPALLQVLSLYGHHAAAVDLATSRAFPSLGYMIEQGATTIWERWDTDAADPAMNSHNHYTFGAMLAWAWEHLAGLQPLTANGSAGFRRFRVAPQAEGKVTWCRARHRSRRGEVVSSWRRDGGRMRLEVVVPPDATAEVHLLGDAADLTCDGRRLSDAPGVTIRRYAGQFTISDVSPGRHEFVGEAP